MATAACLTARSRLTNAVKGATTSGLETAVSAVNVGRLATITSREKHVGGLAGTMGLDAVTHYPEAFLDFLASKVLGSSRSSSPINPLTAAGPVLKAGARGVKDMASAIVSGVDPERVPTGFNLNTAAAGNGLLGSAMQRMGTIVSAMNKPFFEMAQTASLVKRAQMLATKEGIGGAAYKARVQQLLAHPTDDMAMSALVDAAHGTLSDGNVVADWVSKQKANLRKGMKADLNAPVPVKQRAQAQAMTEGLRGDAIHSRVEELLRDPAKITVTDQPTPVQRAARAGAKSASAVGYTGLSLTVPFEKIQTNIVGRTIDYSPAGLVKGLVYAARGTKDTRVATLSRAIARSGVGTAAGFGIGYALAKSGLISSPDAKGDGQQPLAFKVGNDYYDLKTFGNVSILPMLGASYFYDERKNPQDVSGNLLKATGRELGAGLQHGVTSGITNATSAISGAGDAVKKFLGTMDPTPPLLRQVAKGTDVDRDASDKNPVLAAGKQVEKGIPGLRTKLPAKLDALGREVPHPGGIVDALLDPAYHTRVPDTKADEVLTRTGVIPRLTTGVTINGEKTALPKELRDALVKEFGAAIKPELEKLASDKDFQSAPPAEQRKAVQDMVKAIRKAQLGNVRDSIASRLHAVPR
jgi:hypothetical protein